MQIIEGPKPAVETLFSKIKADPRHKNVLVVSRQAAETRDFPAYHMGYKRLKTRLTDKEIPGYTDIIEQGRIPKETLETLSTHIRVFLQSFAKVARIDSD